MVKRPRGSAALVSPCWRPGIWPLFEHQSCNFLCLPLFSVAFERLGQMNKTKAIFKMILLCPHPFMPYFFIIKWAHVLVPLFHPTSTFCNVALFFFFSLYSRAALLITLPFLLSFLPSLPIPPIPPRCALSCDCLLLTHGTSAAPQMRAKGRARCRTQGAGFNEASLNEFTAFHWAAPSHVAH